MKATTNSQNKLPVFHSHTNPPCRLDALQYKQQKKWEDFAQTANRVLTVSSSSRASVSPVVLLKLLVLDEEREMFGLPLLHSFSFINGLLIKKTTKGNGNDENLKTWLSADVFF